MAAAALTSSNLQALQAEMLILPPELQEEMLLLPPDLQEKLLLAMTSTQRADGAESPSRISFLENGSEAPAAAAAAWQQSGGRSLQSGEQACWHGILGAGMSWEAPRLVAGSEEKARPGYQSCSASEYLDTPEVLKAKVQLLAEMWKRSGRDTVIYTGAGLSTASGIGDYASKASKSVAPHKKQAASSGSRLDLKPTAAHHVLAAMEAKGLIGNWVQQNHDRLAQKAGFPQRRLNEIHGAWGDAKNQVKMMDDTLRADLLRWLEAWAAEAKLCVALGTSLCGMNADQVPAATAQRFSDGTGEGLVVIGLQRTVYDESGSLRIWGLCDQVMTLLAKELKLQVPDKKVAMRGQEWDSRHPRLTYNTPTRSAKDPL